MRIEMWQEETMWNWQAVTANGRIICLGATSYSRKSHCKEAVMTLFANIYANKGKTEIVTIVPEEKEYV